MRIPPFFENIPFDTLQKLSRYCQNFEWQSRHDVFNHDQITLNETEVSGIKFKSITAFDENGHTEYSFRQKENVVQSIYQRKKRDDGDIGCQSIFTLDAHHFWKAGEETIGASTYDSMEKRCQFLYDINDDEEELCKAISIYLL